MKLKIEYISTEDLKTYANNAKIHTDEQIEQIKTSIREFGFNDPIAVWKNNEIIEGHGRLIAATDLGMDQVPIIRLDGLSDEERRAYMLVHNKLTMDTGFDLDILNLELDDIVDIDMEQFGFDIEIEEENPIEVVEDNYEPIDVESRCKTGDVWQLGNHRLICGDSTDVTVIDRLMDGVKADMVFTDPPYGYEYQSNMRTKTEKFDVIENDDKKLDFMPTVKQFNNGFVFVCTTWKVLKEWLEIFTRYYDLSNMIIWDKGGGGIGDLKHTFLTDYEIILCSNNDKEITGKRIGSVWNIQKDNANDYVHATQKPVEVSATAIQNTTNENDKVLDLFGGSGSTLIACEQLNRKCYMCELDEHYCDIILQRWETFTGKKAVLLND